MKKIAKWFLIVVASVLGLLLLIPVGVILFGDDQSENRITVSEPISLEMDLTLSDISSNCFIIGKTNLPDSTSLFVDFLINGNTKGQTKAIVEYGRFEFEFGMKLINFDQIEISCYRNKHHQNESVLKQLAFVNQMKTGDHIDKVFSIKELKSSYFSQLLDYDNAIIDLSAINTEVKSVNFAQTKRSAINLYVEPTISNEELEKYIKYSILNEIVKDSNIKAIVVKCFHKGEDITFRSNAVFAPYGEWAKANEDVGFSEYKLKI